MINSHDIINPYDKGGEMMASDDKPSPFTIRGYAILWMVLLMCACAALSVEADDAGCNN